MLRGFLLAALAGVLSAPAGAQARFVSQLEAPDSAHEALFGTISPDGSRFAYRVTEGKLSSIWILELPGLHASRLSVLAGALSDLTWSPDGKQLAFWRNDPDRTRKDAQAGLFVLDLTTGGERRLASLAEGDTLVPMAISWLNDGRIVTGHRENLWFMSGLGALVPFAITADGSPAKLPQFGVMWKGDGRLSRFGDAARIDSCCGGNRAAVYVADASGERCVAGPLPRTYFTTQWTEGGRDLLLFERTFGVESSATYRVSLSGGGAEHLRLAEMVFASVSFTRAGDMAITVADRDGRHGSLWWISALSLVAVEPEKSITAVCPAVAPQIVALAHASPLGKSAIIDVVARDNGRDLTFYHIFEHVPREVDQVYPGGFVLSLGTREGWVTRILKGFGITADSLVPPSALFPLRATDRYLLDGDFEAALAGDPGARAAWRSFAVGDPQTPAPDVLRMVRQNASQLTPFVLANPNILG